MKAVRQSTTMMRMFKVTAIAALLIVGTSAHAQEGVDSAALAKQAQAGVLTQPDAYHCTPRPDNDINQRMLVQLISIDTTLKQLLELEQHQYMTTHP
ncbi:hypothetical protein [Robbsia andropogonis]|uniref:hypothetical protein n=2 Tax=Robbsia andropogonis TaxID=28092 RepID=UPI002A6B8BD2|nr:hypothetical protein [Robbsia andropogonis]